MRIVLCSLFALVAAPAWAEWEKVDENTEGHVYIDRASIKKDGNFRKVWELIEPKQQGPKGARSMRVLKEYNCKEDRSRVLSFAAFSDPMLRGKMLESGDPVDFGIYIAPHTTGAAMLKIVCAM
jgi:hypothetical protein